LKDRRDSAIRTGAANQVAHVGRDLFSFEFFIDRTLSFVLGNLRSGCGRFTPSSEIESNSFATDSSVAM
jgi:hypothetical protein